MAIKIGHASMSEDNSTGWDGKASAGDQTKKEVCTRTWYNGKWDFVIRAKDSAKAEKMAKACEAACANNNIGYDQSQRATLYSLAKKVNYDLSKIKTPCECDCSTLMDVCALAAGYNVAYNLRTATMKTGFSKVSGFEILTDSKYLTSDAYLKRGDILVRTGYHTVMALQNGSKATTSSSTPTSSSTLKVGSSVNYEGYVYSNSNGGSKVSLSKRTMYIAKVLTSKKYPILLSKTKGGTGFGYVSASALGGSVSTTTTTAKTYHVVKRGETLSGLAKRYKTTVAHLVGLNGLQNANVIYVGQRLRVK